MADNPQGATGPMNGTLNVMMKPFDEMDAIRLEPVVWIDSDDLDEIHAGAEEATDLEPQADAVPAEDTGGGAPHAPHYD